jgi:hypothetical protein
MARFITSLKRLFGKDPEQVAARERFEKTLANMDRSNSDLDSILKDIEDINARTRVASDRPSAAPATLSLVPPPTKRAQTT